MHRPTHKKTCTPPNADADLITNITARLQVDYYLRDGIGTLAATLLNLPKYPTRYRTHYVMLQWSTRPSLSASSTMYLDDAFTVPIECSPAVSALQQKCDENGQRESVYYIYTTSGANPIALLLQSRDPPTDVAEVCPVWITNGIFPRVLIRTMHMHRTYRSFRKRDVSRVVSSTCHDACHSARIPCLMGRR